jgi:ubiquinone/menaquinone biosynthesis C-methylase UbiE
MTDNRRPQPQAFDHNIDWKSKSVAEHYDERRFRSLGGKLYDKMEKRAIGACLNTAEHLSPITTMLDLACGTGRISEFLSMRGYRLTCGDISEEMLKVAKARMTAAGADSVTYLTLDIYTTGQPDSHFDCVSAFRLFQHLTSEQRARALREMARISRRFVLVNVMYNSRYYAAVRTLRRALGRYTTRYTSTQRELDEELSYSGLTVVKSVFTQPGFNGNLVLLLQKTSQDGG